LVQIVDASSKSRQNDVFEWHLIFLPDLVFVYRNTGDNVFIYQSQLCVSAAQLPTYLED
jgi:hypothetical protein